MNKGEHGNMIKEVPNFRKSAFYYYYYALFLMSEKYLNPFSEEKWIRCWQQKRAQTNNMSGGVVELQIF